MFTFFALIPYIWLVIRAESIGMEYPLFFLMFPHGAKGTGVRFVLVCYVWIFITVISLIGSFLIGGDVFTSIDLIFSGLICFLTLSALSLQRNVVVNTSVNLPQQKLSQMILIGNEKLLIAYEANHLGHLLKHIGIDGIRVSHQQIGIDGITEWPIDSNTKRTLEWILSSRSICDYQIEKIRKLKEELVEKNNLLMNADVELQALRDRIVSLETMFNSERNKNSSFSIAGKS